MLLYNLIYANNDAEQPLYHDLINRLVDYDIDTDLSSSMVGYSVDGLMLGAFENMHITSNIYGNTPITAKALDYIQIDNGIIDPSNTGSITIETGKITCGNDFTSSNTPYSRDECPSCGIEGQIGSSVAPQTLGKTLSNRMDMPDVDKLKDRSLDNQNSEFINGNGKELVVYPNPVRDLFMIVIEGELQEIMLLDQNATVVKEYISVERIFNIQDLSAGIYTLILKFSNNETKYIKVVKY